MKLTDKLNFTKEDLIANGPITIVAFGDSVTHGAVSGTEINYETVYWNRLKQKINNYRNYVPVNVINAGIGGITALGSLERIDRDVLSHNPDLVIVCFGLNDVNGPLEEYIDSLKVIFERTQNSGSDIIFMTPNMLNTSVAEDTSENLREYAIKTAEMQNSGRMDMFMESAIKLAAEMNVKVCDCYNKWKELSESQDVTYLLANRINHPIREMHELFAQSLFEIIFDGIEDVEKNNSTMYE